MISNGTIFHARFVAKIGQSARRGRTLVRDNSACILALLRNPAPIKGWRVGYSLNATLKTIGSLSAINVDYGFATSLRLAFRLGRQMEWS